MTDSKPLLEIRDLKLEFGAGDRAVRAVDGVSFTIRDGETVCLVGESGCGKSVTALSIARLVPTPPASYAGGEIWLDGRETLTMSPRELRSIRGGRSEEHTSELQSQSNLVCRLLLEKKNAKHTIS